MTNRLEALAMPKQKRYYDSIYEVNPYFHKEFNGLVTTSIIKEDLDSISPYAR